MKAQKYTVKMTVIANSGFYLPAFVGAIEEHIEGVEVYKASIGKKTFSKFLYYNQVTCEKNRKNQLHGCGKRYAKNAG